MSTKVFLSYAANDSDLAELVKAKIKQLLPHINAEPEDVFDVGSDLVAGTDVRRSIKSAIESANAVVVISSESSDSSPWVNYEVGLADALGKELLVVEKEGAADSAMRRRLLESARIIKIDNG